MWKLILAIVAVVFILKYSIALLRRGILISRVKNDCRENGLEFKKCKNLYLSATEVPILRSEMQLYIFLRPFTAE